MLVAGALLDVQCAPPPAPLREVACPLIPLIPRPAGRGGIGDTGAVPRPPAIGSVSLVVAVAALAPLAALSACAGPATARRVVSGRLEGPRLDMGSAPPVDIAAAPANVVAPPVPPVPGTAATVAPGAAAIVAPRPPAGGPLLPPTDRNGLVLAPGPDGIIPAPPLPAAKDAEGYTTTSFDVLADYDAGPLGLFGPSPELVASGELTKLIPEKVRRLDRTRIGLSGYMIPIDFEKNTVQTFLLCRWQPGCCFGHVPKAHEQIYVEMPAGKGTEFVMIPITVYGTFKIGRDEGDLGGMLSLYRMTADRVVIPEDW